MQMSFAILIPSNIGDCITGIDEWLGGKWWGNFIVILINELVMGEFMTFSDLCDKYGFLLGKHGPKLPHCEGKKKKLNLPYSDNSFYPIAKL